MKTLLKYIQSLDEPTQTLTVLGSALIAAALFTRLFRWVLDKSFNASSKRLNVDPTRYKFLKNAISFIVLVLTLTFIVSFVPKLKSIALTVFAGAGIFVAILGFAAQAAFSNIIGGIFIVIFKPFRVGDMIKVGAQPYGIVEDITLRHTVITNFENKRIVIPNSVISSETIVNDNIEDEKVCKWIEIGISYDSNVDDAIRILKEICKNHPLQMDVRTPEEISAGKEELMVRLLSFGEYSVNLRAYVWTENPVEAYQMHSDINKELKKRFDEAGIEIPFPYRTIVFKDDKKHEQFSSKNK